MTGEEHFRSFMARSVLIATALNSCLVCGLAMTGVFTLPVYHLCLLASQGLLCVFMYASFCMQPKQLRTIVWIYVSMALVVQFSTDLLPIDDVMRFTWSFPYAAAGVAAGGMRAGLFVLATSIVSILVANGYYQALPISSITTLCFSLIVTYTALAFVIHYVFRTLDALQKSNEALFRLARTDVVTGIANRLAFEQRLKQLVADRKGFWIVLADLDYFKNVNDTYGHEAGDTVLRRVAAVLSDAIKDDGFAARVGGEEFCLLFSDPDSEHVVQRIEAIRQNIEHDGIEHLGQIIHITASFGLIESVAPHPSADRLYSLADRALYQAKDGGRNQSRLARIDHVLDTA